MRPISTTVQVFSKMPSVSRRWPNLVLSAVFCVQSMAVEAIAAAQLSPAVMSGQPQALSASHARLEKVSFEDSTLKLSLDKQAEYRVFTLSRPPRLVVELFGTALATPQTEAQLDGDVLKRIRSAQFKSAPEKVARVVIDMKRTVPFESRREGNNIMVSFQETGSVQATEAKAGPDSQLEGEASATLTSTAVGDPVVRTPSRRRSRDLLASLPKHPVAIDFDNADIRDVLRVLSEMSGINIIHGPDITGLLSIHLDKVPFNQAFETILAMQGLVAQQMGDNILRVLTPAALSADRGRAVTQYKTFVLNYAKAADVSQHIASLRISPNGKITVDERTNSLVVTDTAEGLSVAERLIGELDQKPQQVMIEARMVEVRLSDTLNIGVQWEYSNNTLDDGTLRILGVRKVITGTEPDPGEIGFLGARVNAEGELEDIVTSSARPQSRGTGVSLPGPQTSAFTFGFINNTDLLTATLNALATKGLTKVLSNPKVVTVNNRLAKIQVGSRLPIRTTSVSPGGTVTENVTFLDVGIILTVTPTINADNRIRLNVKPEVSFPDAAPLGVTPTINTRNAETEVLIRDGETLVIGGLIDEQVTKTSSKVPLMGDIPILGVFFRSTSDSKRRSELVVFLTPRIVQD